LYNEDAMSDERQELYDYVRDAAEDIAAQGASGRKALRLVKELADCWESLGSQHGDKLAKVVAACLCDFYPSAAVHAIEDAIQ
jgi:hypothetical protein